MIYKAEKTIQQFEECLQIDQGAAYRQNLQKVLPHIGDAYRGADVPFRSHLGASLIGKKCARSIWYGFRWFKRPKFSGRLLRLFNRGHLEEGRLIALLLTIGVQVYQQDANGKQFRISDCEGHFGGSGDGILVGIPDLPPTTQALGEFKTHNVKSFEKLKSVGVKEAKPDHFVQMQCYLNKMGLAVALYLAVCKDTDEIWGELIFSEFEVANQHIERAHNIIKAKVPPKKLSESPGWYECKWCSDYSICHGKDKPDRNCRTCKFSEPIANGEWLCTNTGEVLTTEKQLQACSEYETI